MLNKEKLFQLEFFFSHVCRFDLVYMSIVISTLQIYRAFLKSNYLTKKESI